MAAFQFFKSGDNSTPIVEYEKLDEDQAAAKEQEARKRVELDKLALREARTALETAQAGWESAQLAKEQAERKQEQADAENLLAQATTKLEEAKSRLKAAEDKFKTADQLRAEAEAERQRVAALLAQEEAHREALLGKWTRPDSYGQFRLEFDKDGTGLMVIDFNTTTGFLLGAKRLEIDITWEVANGNHVIFDSLRGRPEKAFQVVTDLKGTHRDEVLVHIDEKTFTTHDANNKSKKETWTRIPEE